MRKTLSFIALLLGMAMAAVAQKADTLTTASGIKYYWISKGNGPAFVPGEVAICDYLLTLPNGTKIDATADRNEPFATPIPSLHIIRGYNEIIQLMHVGDRGIFILPYNLGYGERGAGPIPPRSTLVYEITLRDMKAKSASMVLDSVLFAKPVTAEPQPQMDALRETFKAMKKNKFADVYMASGELNTIGYELIKKYPADAVEVFKWNAKLYPKDFNVYDSLGEAYMDAGDKKKATKYYKKSLKLNPKNTNATDMIKKMGE